MYAFIYSLPYCDTELKVRIVVVDITSFNDGKEW